MKPERDEEAEAFLRDSSESENTPAPMNNERTAWARSRSYIRLVLEIAMAATIIFLLFFRAPATKALRRTPVPDCMFV